MSTHSFIVHINVDGTPVAGRDPAEYARAALATASLREASRLDGFGDLDWEADIEVDAEL